MGAALIRYRELSEQPDTDLAELSRVQAELEAGDGWRFDNAISQVLTRLQLPADRPMLAGQKVRLPEPARRLTPRAVSSVR